MMEEQDSRPGPRTDDLCGDADRGAAPKHTPGPWYVRGCDLIGESTILATLCWHSGREQENAADYALIAAAPDLLRACHESAQTFRRYEDLHRAKHTPDGDEKAYANHVIAELVEAAIAKATGLPGGFIGDIFFGDPRHSTRGTHRWDGVQWIELPSEAEVLTELLAQARAERDTWRKAAERMVEEPDALAAALAQVGELRKALEPLLTVCVRIGSTTREDVDAINRARQALRAQEQGSASKTGSQGNE